MTPPIDIQPPNIMKFDHREFSIEALHEEACAFAENKHALKGEVLPTWIVNAPGHAIWVETKWRDENEKHAHATMIGVMCNAVSAKAYTLITEVYVAMYAAKPGEKEPDTSVMPSERPENERDEVLMVMTTTKDDRSMLTRYLITPRRHGNPLLGPRVDEDGWTKGYGFMSDLFDIGSKRLDAMVKDDVLMSKITAMMKKRAGR